MLRLSGVAAKFADITVTALLADGNVATIAGVDVAVVAPGSKPSSGTVWVAAHWVAPIAQVMLIGPYATPISPPPYQLIVPPIGGDLWARVTDTPEIDVVLIDRIELE